MWILLVLTSWLPDNKIAFKLRGALIKPFFKKCGKNFQVGRDVTFLNPFNITIGDNVYLAKGGWYNGLGSLIIEDEVVCAPYVVISTLQHVFKNNSVRFGGSTYGEVKIGKGSWIASHSSVKCGVNIGKGCIVAANASVITDVKDYSLVGGVPAKFIKEVVDGESKIFNKIDLIKKEF